jgi:MFS family permease
MSSRSGLASAVAVNVAAGTLFSWSILPPALADDLGRSADGLGIVFSTALLVFALAVLLGGAPVDRHGPRRATVVAGLLSGSGLAVGAVAPDAAVLHVGLGVLFGLGSGLAYLSAVSWASTRGPGGATWQVAVVVAAYAAGPVVAAPLGTAGIDLWGWRPTLAVAAVVVCGVSLVASRGLPGPLPPGRSVTGSGAAAEEPAAEDARGPVEVGIGDGAALVALWSLFFGAAVPGLLAFAYAAQVATERGVPVEVAGLVVAVTAAGNLLGRLLPAPLTTRSGLLAAMWAGQAALLLAVGTLAWSSSVAGVVVGLPLLALVYGMV